MKIIYLADEGRVAKETIYHTNADFERFDLRILTRPGKKNDHGLSVSKFCCSVLVTSAAPDWSQIPQAFGKQKLEVAVLC